MYKSLGTVDLIRTLPLERALQQAAVGLAACDAEGGLTYLSPVLQEILGHGFAPVTEDEYTRAFDLVDEHGEPLPVERIPLARARRRGEVVRDELLTSRRPDGELVLLQCSALPLGDERGGIAGAVVLVQDLSASRPEIPLEAISKSSARLSRLLTELGALVEASTN